MDAGIAQWLDAIGSRSYDNARQLLWPDQDVNVRGVRGATALHVVAALHNGLKKVQKLLLDGADPLLTDDEGRTPLCVAQRHNHTEIVQYLIFHEELLRALEKRLGRPPELADVIAAMRHKKMRHFREDVRRRVEMSSTKLISAAREGDLETVKRMVESNEITIDAVDEATGETAFSAALAAGRASTYEYLLANDAHIYAPCIVGGNLQPALATASATRDVDFVRRLVARGAIQVGVGFEFGSSPVAEAVKSGCIEMVDALLAFGVRGDARRHGLVLPWPAYHAFDFISNNLDDVTPWWLLAIACWQQDTVMINHLFQTQTELSDRWKLARHGAHALFLAVCQQNEHIVADLLDRGVSINERINRDLTAVVAAVSVDSVRMLHFLIDRGADAAVIHSGLNFSTGSSEGLLATALFVGAMDCARVLLPMERRPTHLDQALHQAAKRGDLDFAHLLLEIALPSTPRALLTTISRTSCPLMLDLLLSRCSDEQFDFAALNSYFSYACRTYSADVVSVFLAYGIDINFENRTESIPPLAGALLLNSSAGVAVAQVLVENGLELVQQRRFDAPPLLFRLQTFLRDPSRACNREFYEAGAAFLTAHGLPQYA